MRRRILERDKVCRWCGRTGVPLDAHHIRYRRSSKDDVAANLIALCRRCHEHVHGQRLANGGSIGKWEAQEILWALVDLPGVTGMALRRWQASSGGSAAGHP